MDDMANKKIQQLFREHAEPLFSVEDMRRLNCMDYSTFCYMMSWREDYYAEDKFSMMKNKGVSTFLMNLDNSKIWHVRSYLDS